MSIQIDVLDLVKLALGFKRLDCSCAYIVSIAAMCLFCVVDHFVFYQVLDLSSTGQAHLSVCLIPVFVLLQEAMV
jgi:hypothetical protein